MRLVVTGSGRSGTGWCAQTLNSAGIYTGHERVFGPRSVATGSVDWQEYHADCSWLAVPNLPLFGVRACLVVRNPLDVVASMAHIGFGIGQLDNHYSDIAKLAGMTPDLDGWLRFWLLWNHQALEVTETVFVFDDLLADPSLLTRWAGAHYPPKNVGVVNDRPEWKTDHRPQIGWGSFTDSETVEGAQALWEGIRACV